MSRGHTGRATVVTGASGYVGGLVAAALLAHEDGELLLPVRSRHARDGLLARLDAEVRAQGGPPRADWEARVHFTALEAASELPLLSQAAVALGADEVVHCLGCLDYFDSQELERVNIEGAVAAVELCRRMGDARLTYVSTAFASGFSAEPIPEVLHDIEADDPTEYTRTKRRAEHVVAESGLPWMILRPSIVIGDSQDGHYSGKTYGLYQLWNGIERLLLNRDHEVFDIAAPQIPVPLLHQDDWQRVFLALRARGWSERIVHVVSDDAGLPTKRELWHLWMEHCFRPERVRYYPDMDALPVREMDRRQRALMAIASVNIEIATHRWRFDAGALRSLDLLPRATLESVWRCQQRYMEASPAIAAYRSRRDVFRNRSIEVESVGAPVLG